MTLYVSGENMPDNAYPRLWTDGSLEELDYWAARIGTVGWRSFQHDLHSYPVNLEQRSIAIQSYRAVAIPVVIWLAARADILPKLNALCTVTQPDFVPQSYQAIAYEYDWHGSWKVEFIENAGEIGLSLIHSNNMHDWDRVTAIIHQERITWTQDHADPATMLFSFENQRKLRDAYNAVQEPMRGDQWNSLTLSTALAQVANDFVRNLPPIRILERDIDHG